MVNELSTALHAIYNSNLLMNIINMLLRFDLITLWRYRANFFIAPLPKTLSSGYVLETMG